MIQLARKRARERRKDDVRLTQKGERTPPFGQQKTWAAADTKAKRRTAREPHGVLRVRGL